MPPPLEDAQRRSSRGVTGARRPSGLKATASLAYLDALGIDVWVRRELLATRSRADEDAGTPKPRADVTAEQVPARKPAGKPAGEPVGEPAVAFTIRCVRFGRVLALIDESLWRERRFFLDVARAMHGPGSVERESLRFEWPQLRSADAGMEAAGRAFRAYLEMQVREDTRILAAGARVRELIGGDLDRHIYLDRALRGLTEKKSLWRRIRKLTWLPLR